ncbi:MULTISPECIES: metallophosphoesterase family protein [unclassified Ensifer]|uniref:metallophosphoesterase family protein n=1 Tax=unclassified Ensifer TaxID=2633371 RepID=UPI000DDA95EE|nr:MULTISPECIES: metallophosphoesterase family protein [unclassified Ensifer]MBD9495687.1 metallophosphoesterase family protein [Ensifer sp. ENS01]MBD9523542.1 metallophosphoesterase family protein [Ensifer sp. ENS02]
MIAIISDIHGNLPALEAVLARIDELGCSSILSLGDVVGYYAQPGDCIDALKARGIQNIMGNHDHYIVSGEGCPRSKMVNDIIEHQRGIISADQRAWLAESRSKIIDGSTYFVHGSWQDPIDEYLYQVSETHFPEGAERLFTGHTHVQVRLEIGGKTFCNPGSVGQPRDGDPRAAFALLSAEGSIELHRVEYDIDRTAFHMQQAGFPARCYENLYIGAQIGGRIDRIVAAEGACEGSASA